MDINEENLLPLNEMIEASFVDNSDFLMKWASTDEDPLKISFQNFIESCKREVVQGFETSKTIDWFGETVTQSVFDGMLWLKTSEAKIYEYDLTDAQWYVKEDTIPTTVYRCDMSLIQNTEDFGTYSIAILGAGNWYILAYYKGAEIEDQATILNLINGKVDKELGKSLLADTEIDRLLSLENYDDSELRSLIAEKADAFDIVQSNGTGTQYVDVLGNTYYKFNNPLTGLTIVGNRFDERESIIDFSSSGAFTFIYPPNLLNLTNQTINPHERVFIHIRNGVMEIHKKVEVISPMVTLNHSSLLALVDSESLTAGQRYRINDYGCTTVQADTRTAGHWFDIIVEAIDSKTLSETAFAAFSDRDYTFVNTNFGAWELKYCLKNDTTRFAWADEVNGKGVIYFMKDEWGNELHYDFKNIQYYKNNAWVYTFGGDNDDTLLGGSKLNKDGVYIDGSQRLNSNKWGVNCNGNVNGNGCYGNVNGNGCYGNVNGNDCGGNVNGNYCGGNVNGNGCYGNVNGNGCNGNVNGNNCNGNVNGNNCNGNVNGNYCGGNVNGNGCYGNVNGDGCNGNVNGNNCNGNVNGNNCSYNKHYHGTSGNTPKDYVRYVSLEDGVQYNNFYSSVTTSGNSYLQRIRIKGLVGTSGSPLVTQINTTTNNNFEWVIAKNTTGVVKQYCVEDLVP